ncbi:MAG TPA: Sapep family Mn(2+)-dependent dipeptidase [Bacilli bacterium]|nr:Sapep family Mn(2+)-dependent dipeptidase [Bacilli bacterium]HPS19103.1 Sapep family Mn(2+)-dependent dipeptidase [Bacilli bacterium]
MQKPSIYQKLARNYHDLLLENLTSFVAIDSTYDQSSVDENNPFGKGVSQALNFVADLAKKDGFIVNNYDNKVVEILLGEGKKNITIMAHVDVVPAGTGWHQDPFTVTDHRGVLCARGVADDKGPLLASYYAMKLLRDNHLLGEYQVRFLAGGNEERGSQCMEHYFKELKKPQPTLGFSPDSDFPLIYGEKGIINFEVKKSMDINGVFSIHGGVANNSVIERCVVRMRDNQFFLRKLQSEGIEFLVNFLQEGMEVTFIGKAAHGSIPEEGLNAGIIAIKALSDFLEDENLRSIVEHFSDLEGKGLEVSSSSESMGHNSLNVGLLDYENNQFSMVVNFRHVDGVEPNQLIETFKENAKPFSVEVMSISPLLFYPLDSVLASTLLAAYQEETGDLESKPLTTGGGTYAKEADNVIAFGTQFPGWDSMMHSPGESMKKTDLFKSIAIYARAIVELGKKLDENKI